jgi:phosphate uptake regulator
LADRPPDLIIEDDDAIDRWYENYVREVNRKAKRPTGNAPAFSELPTFSA